MPVDVHARRPVRGARLDPDSCRASTARWRRTALACAAVLAAAGLTLAPGDAAAQRRPTPAPSAAPTPGPAQPSRPTVTPETVGDALILWLLDVVQEYEVRREREPAQIFHRRVLEAVRRHPQYQGLGQGSEAAERAIDEAWAGYLPTITGSGDGGYRRFGPTFAGTPGYSRDGVGFGLQMRQNVYDFGVVAGQVDAARQRLDAALAKRDVAEIELGFRAVQAHFDVLRNRMLQGLGERNVLDRTQLAALLRSRQELGGSGEPEVRRANARLAGARSALVTIENRLRTAEAVYREVYGASPERLVLPEDVDVPATPEAALDAARQNHPSLREARANSAAARADAGVAEARTLPSVGVEGNVLRRNQIGEGEPATDASLLLVMRYNLYTGGADTARRNLARARSRQAEFDASQAERQLDRSVRQAIAEVENGARAIDARIHMVIASIEALRANRQQLEMNRGSITELLRVQEELFDAGRDLIEAVFDRAVARYRLLQLTGDLTPLLESSATLTARAKR